MKNQVVFFLTVAVLVLAISGCASPTPTPVLPTSTEQEAQPTAVASATSAPAPVPTDMPSPAPSPTPTLRPEGWLELKTDPAKSPVSRTGFALAILPDGRMLLFGGRDANGKALGDTWVLDPNAVAQSSAGGRHGRLSIIQRPLMADWTPITSPDSPAARQGHSMVTLPDGRVLLYGGSDDQGAWFNDLRLYAADKWSGIIPANEGPSARANHNAWVRDNKMYVSGGQGAKGLVEDLWRYDLLSNTWQQLAKPLGFISPHAFPAVDGRRVVFLDPHVQASGGGPTYSYDMESGQWEQSQPQGLWPPGQRSFMAWTQAGDRVFMLGGKLYDPATQSASLTAEAWGYQLSTGDWTQLADMPYPVSGGKVVYDLSQDRFFFFDEGNIEITIKVLELSSGSRWWILK